MFLLSAPLLLRGVKADSPISYTLNWNVGDGIRALNYTTYSHDFTAVIHSNARYTGNTGNEVDAVLSNSGGDGIYIGFMFGDSPEAWDGNDMVMFSQVGGIIISGYEEFQWSDPSNETLTIDCTNNNVAVYMNDVLLTSFQNLNVDFSQYSIGCGDVLISGNPYGLPMEGTGMIATQINNLATYVLWSYTPAPSPPVSTSTSKVIVFNYGTDFGQFSPYRPPSPSNNYTVRQVLSNFATNGMVQVDRDLLDGWEYGNQGYVLTFSDSATSGNVSESVLYQSNFIEFDLYGFDLHVYQHVAGEPEKTLIFGMDGQVPDFNFTLTNNGLYIYVDDGHGNPVVVNEGGSLITVFNSTQSKVYGYQISNLTHDTGLSLLPYLGRLFLLVVAVAQFQLLLQRILHSRRTILIQVQIHSNRQHLTGGYCFHS